MRVTGKVRREIEVEERTRDCELLRAMKGYREADAFDGRMHNTLGEQQ